MIHPVGTEGPLRTATFPAVEDEYAASQTDATLLITASTRRTVEALARQIHAAGARARLPFVQTRACDLPVGPKALKKRCSGYLDSAAGGSLLIGDIEDLPPTGQDGLLEVIAALEFARQPSAAVRLIAGTTVSLLERVTAGTFSDRLFYRLNIIHLMQRGYLNGRLSPIPPQ